MPEAGEAERRAKLAAGELSRAREDAQARRDQNPYGERRRRPAPAAGGTAESAGAGSRGRRDDPDLLSSAIDGLLKEEGWREAALIGSVSGRWREIVGEEVAAHTSPGRLEAGELTVHADSAAWATQVRLLAGTLIRRLNEELGHGTVTRVNVRGPAGPPRQAGQWRVRSGVRRSGGAARPRGD